MIIKRFLLVFSVLALSTMSCYAVTAEEQKAYDDFMLKLKSCTPTNVELFDGKHEVLGYNQNCGYKVQYKSGESYSCHIPTPVAAMFGYQSTVALREGAKSSFVESILNNRNYCQKN